MDKIKPDYYKKDGKDLLDEFFDTLMTKEQVTGFCLGNAIKYLTRYDQKNGLEDLQKANEYLNRMLEHHSKSTQNFTEGEMKEFLSKVQELSHDVSRVDDSSENEEDFKKNFICSCLENVKKALFEEAFSVKQLAYITVSSTQLDLVISLIKKK